MSSELRVALVQVGAIRGDLEGTLEKTEQLVARAAERGARLALLPELFHREYFAQYRDSDYVRYAEPHDGETYRAVTRWAAAHDIWIVAGIYEKVAPGLLYDAAVLVAPTGEIRGTYRKTHPAAVRSLEKLYFRGGSEFPVWDVEGWKVGCNICYDVWFPEAARCSSLHGAELLVMPFATAEVPLYPDFFRCRAFENGIYVAVANKVGREGQGDDAWLLQGRSCVVDPEGNVVVMASRTEETVEVVTLEKQNVDRARTRAPMYRDRRPEIYGRIAALFEEP